MNLVVSFFFLTAFLCFSLSVEADQHDKDEGTDFTGGQGKQTYFSDEDCSEPGPYINDVIEVANKSENISDLIDNLGFPACTVAGANTSFSAQLSLSNRDPRIYLKTRCRIVTFSLWGASLELGIPNQKANQPLPREISKGKSKLNSDDVGEILVDMRNFPRGDKKFTAAQPGLNPVVNTWNHAPDGDDKKGHYETKGCVGCHNDTRQTKGPLGLKEITVGKEKFSAIVSPYYLQKKGRAEGDLFCFPNDIKLLHHCECENVAEKDKPAQCKQFEALDWTTVRNGDIRKSWGPEEKAKGQLESCRRMAALIRLNTCQNSQMDPREYEEDGKKGKCLSDGWSPKTAPPREPVSPRRTSPSFAESLLKFGP